MKDDHQFFTPVARISPCVMQPDRKGSYVAKSAYMELVQQNLELEQLASQRGERMQIMRDWMAERFLGGSPWDGFLGEYPYAVDWFDEDGVPVQEKE